MTNAMISDLRAELIAADGALQQAGRALAPRNAGGEIEAYEAAFQKLMGAERRLAEAERRPYAVPCECSLSWDIGAPLPTLLQSDQAAFLFFLLSDDDESVGRMQFDGLLSSSLGAPNDETFEGHPLHGSGFEPYRAMEVINSPWIRQLERMNSVHRAHEASIYATMRHFVFPFHDTTFECVARSFTAATVNGRLSEAVKEAVQLLY